MDLGSFGFGLFGSGISSALQYSNAEQNRDLQIEGMRSRHQNQVKDMRAAGLNPILSATGGSGAPMASGSSMGNIENPATSAIQGSKQMTEQDLLEENITVASNTAKKVSAEESRIKADTEYIKNKTKISDPMSTIANVLQTYLSSPAKDVKSAQPTMYEKFKNLPDYLRSDFNDAKSYIRTQKIKDRIRRNINKKPVKYDPKKHNRLIK